MDIIKHKHIPKHEFHRLISNVKYIDSTLSLHFINHVTNPLAQEILQHASNLAQWKININNLENILAISPLYKIYRNQHGTYMSFPDIKGKDRVGEFTQSVNKWISMHQDDKSLAMINLRDVWIRTTSPRKVTKMYSSPSLTTSASPSPSPSPSPTKLRTRFADLKNSRSKFTFKEKNAAEESNKHQGMSLLERIKMKEKLNNSAGAITKEQKREQYLAAKMDQIYNVIHQLYLEGINSSSSNNTKGVSLSFTKIVQIVRDTCDEDQMDQDDIRRIVQLINDRLTNFAIYEKAGITVIRVSHLNRVEDLVTLGGTSVIN